METVVDFECPKCTRKLSATVGEFKRGDQITCPGCGDRITLNLDDPDNGADLIGKDGTISVRIP